jgi:hypothetical protein
LEKKAAMSTSSIPTILTIVFSVTTVVVILYPIIKLTPYWLERSVGKKVVMHSRAIVALDAAIGDAGNTPEHLARLVEQRAFHVAALAQLAPQAAATADAVTARIDAAA